MLPKISQEMLAETIGTTRPWVDFFMNKFRKLDFIKYNGEIHLSCTSNELPSEPDKGIEKNLERFPHGVSLCRKVMSDQITNKNPITQARVAELALTRLLRFLTKMIRRAAIAAAISAITAMRTGCPSCDMTVSTCRP